MSRRLGLTAAMATIAATVVLAATAAPLPAQPGRASRAPRAHASPPYSAAGAATADFGVDLLRRLAGTNVVFSPDSVAAALAMVGTGASGTTRTQIAGALHTSAFSALGRLQTALLREQRPPGGGPDPVQLSIAATLFVQGGFGLEPPFLAEMRGAFGAAPRQVDFAQDESGAVGAINHWVSEQTHGLIPQAVAELSPQTVLALVNAVYLDAKWLDPFRAGATEPGTFHAPGGAQSVPFMHETASLSYGDGPGWRAVELPYEGSTLALLVVLPAAATTAPLEHGLRAGAVEAIARRLKPTRVQLALPRFHLAFKSELDEVLASLGIRRAFTEAAEFPLLDGGRPPLRINTVAHAADMRVDEEGTVAAAATVVGVEALGEIREPQPPVRFVADHPFLFFLRDTRTGAVLFAGRLGDPAAAQG